MAKQKFVTGCLIQDKDGNVGIFEYSYAMAYGGKDYNNITVAWLDEKGKKVIETSHHRKSQFTIIDSDPKTIEDNLKKLRSYNKKSGGAPICMKASLAIKLGYKSIHTYESALAYRKDGSIKL